jgi:hypothetical protein
MKDLQIYFLICETHELGYVSEKVGIKDGTRVSRVRLDVGGYRSKSRGHKGTNIIKTKFRMSVDQHL